jgi:hypothetical protein
MAHSRYLSLDKGVFSGQREAPGAVDAMLPNLFLVGMRTSIEKRPKKGNSLI